jgi:hypothetical protein
MRPTSHVSPVRFCGCQACKDALIAREIAAVKRQAETEERRLERLAEVGDVVNVVSLLNSMKG